MLFVGDRCQPAGTLVQIAAKRPRGRHGPEYREVPIEQVKVGDHVITYAAKDAHYYTSGVVEGVTERFYDGQMITATLADGTTTRYTANHHCYVSFAPFTGKHAVYVMRRGNQYRIGKSTLSRGGPLTRFAHEGADALWILAFYDTNEEAYIAEQSISGKFGLPQLVFNDLPVSTPDLVRRAWEYIGDNSERGELCLRAFGRDPQHPIAIPGNQWQYSFKRPMVTSASNLVTGCLLLKYKGIPKSQKEDWVPITITTDHFAGPVYSFTITPYHTYIADSIVTHNCQAIMAFAGADSTSYDRILTATGAQEFPLSVCYRCPRSHLEDLARREVPDIEARPGAPVGTIASVPEDALGDLVRAGDLVLCRMTAPLIGWCLKLIERMIPARARTRYSRGADRPRPQGRSGRVLPHVSGALGDVCAGASRLSGAAGGVRVGPPDA